MRTLKYISSFLSLSFTTDKNYCLPQIRQHNVAAARKVLGTALGIAPNKEKICLAYVAFETQLGEIGRCVGVGRMAPI